MLKDEVNQMRYRMEQLKGDLQVISAFASTHMTDF